ncbi:hypothetical protein ACYSNR_02880 [Enterococcus sp. LJL128]
MVNSLEKEIIAAGETYLLSGQIAVLPVSGYEEYLASGNRIKFEKSYFERRRQLAVIGLAAYLEDRQEFSELLEQILWEICNEYTWALPAHLPVTGNEYGRESSVYLDLFAAETGQALAEILKLTGNRISPLVYQRVTDEIERRIFTSFESHSWDWEYKENNWSSVVGGCVGMTALSLMPPESRRLARFIKRLDQSMQSYLNGFGSDGACVEGVGYWGYGFGYFLYYAQCLAEVKGDTRYLDLPKTKAIAKFPYYMMMNQQNYIPFSDYSQPELPSGLLSYCQKQFGAAVPEITQTSGLDADHCYRFAQIYRNLVWSHQTKGAEKTAAVQYFQDAEWLVIREPDNDFLFAAKGGTNQESHNHLDVGHFVLGSIDALYLTDLGAGEYTRDYFVEQKRYDYFPPSADSHSIPVINGQRQQPETQSSQKAVFSQMNEGYCFQLELKEFYSKNSELKSGERKFIINQQTGQVKLSDSFSFSQEKNEISERFITQIPPIIQDNHVLLKGERRCEIHFETEQLWVKEKKFKDHSGCEQIAYIIGADYQLGKEAVIEVKIRMQNN